MVSGDGWRGGNALPAGIGAVEHYSKINRVARMELPAQRIDVGVKRDGGRAGELVGLVHIERKAWVEPPIVADVVVGFYKVSVVGGGMNYRLLGEQ